MRFASLVIAVITAGLCAAGLWALLDRPVPVQAEWSGPVESVSFAPFRRGQSPLTKQYPSAAQVEQDMRSLVGLTKGVRTYTALQGMQTVPDLARKLGFTVTYGAWLTSNLTEKGTAQNDREIDALIAGANAHPDVISRVIVGNEVLLRRELKPDELIAYIRKVKAAVRQPVSYADVWEFYLQYPEVVRELDYLTIHILPFWIDEPVSIDDVDQHIADVVQRMRKAFPGKPILIGETGWPSIGRDRGAASVNTVNEARYVRGMANLAARQGFDYNIVEAFDQPWKSALENTVGAAWGIMDVDRTAKFPMTGPVTEVADWPLRAAIAIGLGVAAGLLWGWRVSGFAALLTLALLAQAMAWSLVTTVFHTKAVTFHDWQYAWAPFRVGLAALLVCAVLRQAAILLGARDDRATDPWQGAALLAATGFYAVIWSALLYMDGRYRDIPDIDFSAPALGVLLLIGLRSVLAWRRGQNLWPALSFDGLFGRSAFAGCLTVPVARLALALPIAAVVALASEGHALLDGHDFQTDHPGLAAQAPLALLAMIQNREMVLWAGLQLVLAVPFIVKRWRGTRE